MSTKNPKNSPPPVPAPKAELPVLTTIGWIKSDEGWTVLLVKSRGMEILEREVLGEGAVGRPHAEQTLLIEFNRRIRIQGALEGKASA